MAKLERQIATHLQDIRHVVQPLSSWASYERVRLSPAHLLGKVQAMRNLAPAFEEQLSFHHPANSSFAGHGRVKYLLAIHSADAHLLTYCPTVDGQHLQVNLQVTILN